jgi:hypothetical protein
MNGKLAHMHRRVEKVSFDYNDLHTGSSIIQGSYQLSACNLERHSVYPIGKCANISRCLAACIALRAHP